MADPERENSAEIPDVGGRHGESKGVWRILLISLTLAVLAMAAAFFLFA